MDYLVEHAVKNIWCTPNQDGQYIFRMERVTPTSGYTTTWRALMTSVRTPANDGVYHLFQIGGVYPDLIDLVSAQGVWVSLAESAKVMRTVIDLYFTSGVKIPVSSCFFTYTGERNLFIAIKETAVVGTLPGYAKQCDYSKDHVYVRVYKNAYYTTARWSAQQTAAGVSIPSPVEIKGRLITNTSQIVTYQNEIAAIRARNVGTVTTYKNGWRIDTLDLTTAAVGDYVEYVYDASVLRTDLLEFVGSLGLFNSVMDSRRKYLLRLTGTINTILYQDDADVYLYHPATKIAVYVHKNAPNTLRNITNRDYSLRQDVVQAYRGAGMLFADPTTRVLMVTRRSGYERTLADTHNRIKELYKLNDARIKLAMVGTNSLVPEWLAHNLEADAYPAVVSASYSEITKPLVANAMGYNAVAKVAGSAFEKLSNVVNATRTVNVPYLYQRSSGVFFYDTQGFLLSTQDHVSDVVHTAPANTAYVEWIKGPRQTGFTEDLDVAVTTPNPDWDYRCYVRPKISNAQDNVWLDVTADTTKVTITPTAITWRPGVQADLNTLVRSNQGFIWQTISTPVTDGLMVFPLNSMITVNGQAVTRELEIPPGEIDVYLNGRSLIHGLDYFINFPTLTVVNKEYLLSTGPQVINIRMKGLCNPDMTLTDISEYGFMVAGRLSVDHQFDIRDDKPQRLQINGRVITPADVVFNEDTTSYSTVNAWEGKPYIIKDVVVPMKEITGLDTPTFRARSLSVDKRVSDYITQFRTAPPEAPLTTIATRYKVYSPLIAKLAKDLQSQTFAPSLLQTQYSDQQIQEAISAYMYLYDMDPINPKNRPLENFVIIHPTHLATQMSLNIWQYTFLERVVRMLAPGRVVLTGSITLV